MSIANARETNAVRFFQFAPIEEDDNWLPTVQVLNYLIFRNWSADWNLVVIIRQMQAIVIKDYDIAIKIGNVFTFAECWVLFLQNY